MKEYIFHSRLSVWEIERRLRQAQRDPLEAGLTEVNVTSECGFYLRLCGSAHAEVGSRNGIRAVADTVFYGTVGQIETGSRITGYFSTSKQNKRSTQIPLLVIGALYAWFMLHNRGTADLWFFVSLLPILVLYVVFYLSDNLILNKDQKKRIIAFIEERLLHP